ncbi:MAG: flagellar protein FlaG [Propionivibrio sp.]|nr:flagellar protein FlaG [Propionivibrio sp.]
MSGNLEFSMDDSTGKTVIKVVDSSTHELIRQIPSGRNAETARALDRLQGLLGIRKPDAV